MSEHAGYRHATAEVDARGVATITITHAGSLNILGSDAIDSVREALAAMQHRSDLRLLVLRGTGDKAFVGGADIKEMATLGPTTARAFIDNLRGLCEAVARFPCPVLARIPGYCLGAGLELAMVCDLRIASTQAHFAMPEVRVGIPSVIHAALMPRMIGAGRSNWLLLTGDTIDAATALHWGLIDRMVEPDALDAEVSRVCELLLGCGDQALRTQKSLIRSWFELPLSEAVAQSVERFGQSFQTDEPARMMQPFLKRRRT